MGHSANKGSSPKSDLNLKKRKRVNPFMVILTLFLIGFLGYQLLSKQISQKVQVSPSVLLEDLKNPETATVKVMLGNTMASVVWSVGNGPDIQVKATQIPLDSVDGYFTQEIIASLGDEFQFIPQPPSSSEIFGNILTLLMFAGTLVLVVLFFKGMKNGGPGQAMSFGKIRPQTTEDPNETVTFEDVAGQAEAKQELQEVVDFLKNPDEYHAIGAKIPRGVLLVGMPGTGKTLLARAVAGEAGVSFFHISGSDFVEMFVGVGASRVRDLFEQGRTKAPCIIFIDELDAVGRTRGAGYGGGHDEREQTLNQMLVEMDGFKPTDNVIVLAATNRPDVLDPALLRPGRFDRQVVVDMPDVKEREAILSVHAKKIKTSRSVDLERIAKATPGSSGAELANLVNEAALFAARKKAKKVTMEDFEEARDKLLMGVARRSRVITDEEKLATAYHESGHALLHYYLKHADPLHKVTIIPRGRAAGVTFSLPEKELHFQRKSQLLDRIKLCMGGFVAEKLVYGETTTGTQNDIKQATEIARKMVREFGMSEKMGFLSFGDEDEPIFLGKEFGHAKIYSDETSRFIDEEIKRIIDLCMADATQLLSDHRSDLDLLAHELVARETMEDNDVRKLLGMELIESKFALVDRPEPAPASQQDEPPTTQQDEPSSTEAADVSLPASDETESPALPAAAQPSGGDSAD